MNVNIKGELQHHPDIFVLLFNRNAHTITTLNGIGVSISREKCEIDELLLFKAIPFSEVQVSIVCMCP